MFWNLENFFDFVDGGAGESDTEFSATGPRRWSKKRFYRKCQAVAKTILWAGSGREGAGLPDIVGMAEVENRFVLNQLVTKTALRKLDYETVHFDSPDPRGIDCALLYRASRLTLVSARPCRVSAPDLQTRDILLAQFLTPSGDSLAVLVNHHPSKYGGGETDWRREVAVARLRALGDSLAAAGWTRAVAVGDFNDTPDNPLFRTLEPAFSFCRYTGGRGSIRFNGEWQLIDLCFVSPALAGEASFSVQEPPFLTERDAAHSGDRPLRTYSGPRYLGGVSDHRPILVRLKLNQAGRYSSRSLPSPIRIAVPSFSSRPFPFPSSEPFPSTDEPASQSTSSPILDTPAQAVAFVPQGVLPNYMYRQIAPNTFFLYKYPEKGPNTANSKTNCTGNTK
jgi:endonuclease/exonuclease/phosphatase family metal-dependent hydrolase